MSKIEINKLIELQSDYLYADIPAGQENVSTACFNLQDVKDLIETLPSNAEYVKVVLIWANVLNDPNDPDSGTTKRVSMGMVGADNDGAKIIYNSGGLLADRPCPPDCSSPDGVRARRIS